MQAEVRNIDFIPLTPLTVLPFNDVDSEYMSVAAIGGRIIASYKSSESKSSKLVLLNVNFGSRDTTPLCVPSSNFTTEADGDVSGIDNNCTEIVYRRDGEISLVKQTEIGTQVSIRLQSIGMNLVLGTWNDGQSINAALIRADLTLIAVILQAPVTEIISATATPEDVFIALKHSQGVLVQRYDMGMILHESFVVQMSYPVIDISLTYAHFEGLSLVIATTRSVSVVTFLRDYKSTDRTYKQTNQAPIATMLSQSVPVLDIDQSVMPNGDLVVTFSTIQEIHVQVFEASIFGTNNGGPNAINSPQTVQPYSAPMSDSIVEDPEEELPSWAIALIVIATLLALFFVVLFIVAYQKKRRSQVQMRVQQDPDLIAYTKMNV